MNNNKKMLEWAKINHPKVSNVYNKIRKLNNVDGPSAMLIDGMKIDMLEQLIDDLLQEQKDVAKRVKKCYDNIRINVKED